MKRVISIVLCLMLVLGLAATASAAEIENHTDHAYKAYQIFTGTQATGEGELGQIQWGAGVDAAALLADLKATYDLYDSCTTADDVAKCLTSVAIAREFANVAVQHITAESASIAAGQVSVELAAGYYLMVDQTVITDANDAKNAALLQVTNVGKVTITKKYDIPSHEKNILSTDDAGEHNHVKVEDYAIGEQVTFHLKATLANNMEDYEQYRLVLHDALSEGLTFDTTNADVTVTVGGQTAVLGTDYTIETDVSTCDKGKACTFHIVFEDILNVAGCADGAVVIVSYKATLNENAKIDTANPNEYLLEFSNDPDWDPTTGTVSPTGQTPWKEVEVYTTGVILKKIDGSNDQPLSGAEFTITGERVNKVKVKGAEYVAYTDTNYEAGNKYWLLKDGTYTDEDPAGTGIDTSVYADTITVYQRKSFEKFLEDTDSVDVKAYVDNNGVLELSGLGEGDYTIVESVVPAGYNKIEDIKLKITFDEETETFSYYWDGGATGAEKTITIENNKGSVLPETGGIGTTLFYVIGGLMFAGSAVLLVTKKRMSAE